jgi:hypothetical protein
VLVGNGHFQGRTIVYIVASGSTRPFAQVWKEILNIKKPSRECGLGNFAVHSLDPVDEIARDTEEECVAESGIVDLLNDLVRAAKFHLQGASGVHLGRQIDAHRHDTLIVAIIVPAVVMPVRRGHSVDTPDELAQPRLPRNLLDQTEKTGIVWKERHHSFGYSVIHAELESDLGMISGKKWSSIHAPHDFFQKRGFVQLRKYHVVITIVLLAQGIQIPWCPAKNDAFARQSNQFLCPPRDLVLP